MPRLSAPHRGPPPDPSPTAQPARGVFLHRLSFLRPTAAALFAPGVLALVAPAHAQDDDALPTLSIRPASMDAIREGAPAAFVLERSDDNGTIEVSLRVTSSGEYLSGTTSFGATIENTPGVVTASFPGGSTETRIRFDTDDDEDVEDDASITVQIEADDGGTYVLGTPTSATVAVTSNDVVPDVNISAYPAEIGEGESAVFRLTRLLGAFRLREEMRVKIRVEDAGNDLDASRALGAAEFDADRQPDLQQEIHLALWRSFAGYESRCSLRTWVYRVAHNARVMRARRTEVMAAALIDRLLHHCRIVNIRGNSYPMREHQNLPRSASENPAERVAG